MLPMCHTNSPVGRRSVRPKRAARRRIAATLGPLEARSQPGGLLTSPFEALGDPLSSMAWARTVVDIAPPAPVVRARIALALPSTPTLPGGLVDHVAVIQPPSAAVQVDAGSFPVEHSADLARELGIGGETKDGLSPGTPPTGAGTLPPGATPISGPGSMPIRAGSVVIIADTAPSGDASAMWWDAPSGTPIITGVTGWSGVIAAIQYLPAGSITDLDISGHGNGYGGVGSSTSTATGGGLDGRDLTPEQGAIIRSKLAPGGRVVYYGCSSGGNGGMQLTADKVGVPAVGNTGLVDFGDYGKGDWVRFDPPTPPAGK